MKGRMFEEVETKYSIGLLVTIWLREEEELKRGPRFLCCPPVTGWVVDVIHGDRDYRGHTALEATMNSFWRW